jgi:hypothetical protein
MTPSRFSDPTGFRYSSALGFLSLTLAAGDQHARHVEIPVHGNTLNTLQLHHYS